MSHSFSGSWGTNGFSADDFDGWRAYKQSLIGKRVTVTVEIRHATRSDAANRRYWGRVVRGVMGYLNSKPERQEFPLSKEQVHYVLKLSFLGGLEVDGLLIPKDSHSLTSEAFATFSDEVEAHFAQLGAEFPDDF